MSEESLRPSFSHPDVPGQRKTPLSKNLQICAPKETREKTETSSFQVNSTPEGLSQRRVLQLHRGQCLCQSLEGGKEPHWGLPGFPVVGLQGRRKEARKSLTASARFGDTS